ncbi:hypothetical protein [Kitasatospora sp. McL0602]|uniref:hypothetical protein n=1 Tax=Kitasatospora sp. McL0602 TaxID=3439530 RepID=UPI003F89131F
MSAPRRTPKLLTTTAVAVLLTLAGGGLAAPAGAAAVTAAPRAVQSVRAAGFYAGGVWDLYQSNGSNARVNLSQDGNGHLYGSATSGDMVGTLQDGALVDGEHIYFTITWNNGPVGRYTGVRGADGRLSGTTVDLSDPSSQATWFTQRTF